jgi:hypothetical protein
LEKVGAYEGAAAVVVGAAQSIVSAHGRRPGTKDTVLADRRGTGTHAVDARVVGCVEIARTLVTAIVIDVHAPRSQQDSCPAAVIIHVTGSVDADTEAACRDARVADIALRAVGGVIARDTTVHALSNFAGEAGRAVITLGLGAAAGSDADAPLASSPNYRAIVIVRAEARAEAVVVVAARPTRRRLTLLDRRAPMGLAT